MASRVKTSKNVDEQVEYLDEQEQEELLQDLRNENDKSNLFIQMGLLFVDALVCAIFLVFEYDVQTHESRHQPLYLPFPFLSTPVFSRFSYPGLGVLLSLAAIVCSMVTMVLTCRLTLKEMLQLTSSHKGVGPFHRQAAVAAASVSSVIPLAAMFIRLEWIELVFWCLPWLVLMMNALAIRMMRQVQDSFTALEKSRYKFKGA
ncbi:hypothetical protein DM01DRAFT_1381439 [Hesseltinella vesiculosa]|uniref:Uncharacterized protein n=1 Tax=Hesseltinella vesiculosa TaxID=101127 RepID=A0A1X2GPL6_9FUNG|nr:hypothetical protein DM01DRAFT_1381439 [Hesseltinella vesiculosa]